MLVFHTGQKATTLVKAWLLDTWDKSILACGRPAPGTEGLCYTTTINNIMQISLSNQEPQVINN